MYVWNEMCRCKMTLDPNLDLITNSTCHFFTKTPIMVDSKTHWWSQYAVKVQRSLAPLSWFPGSRKPTAHVHQCYRFQSYAKSRRLHAIANEIYKQNLHCVNHIPGIHDNAPPRTTLWRLTLTAYSFRGKFMKTKWFGGFLAQKRATGNN